MNLSFEDFIELLYLLGGGVKVCIKIIYNGDAVELCEGFLSITNLYNHTALEVGACRFEVDRTGTYKMTSNKSCSFTSYEKEYILEVIIDKKNSQEAFAFDYEYSSFCSNICECIDTLNMCVMTSINSQGRINKQKLMITEMEEKQDAIIFVNANDEKQELRKQNIYFAASKLVNDGTMLNMFLCKNKLILFRFFIMELIK